MLLLADHANTVYCLLVHWSVYAGYLLVAWLLKGCPAGNDIEEHSTDEHSMA